MSSAADALFLEYRAARLSERYILLYPSDAKDKSEIPKTYQGRHHQSYSNSTADASTWTGSLYDEESDAYQNRIAFAQDLDNFERGQKVAYQRRLEDQRQEQERLASAKGAKKSESASSAVSKVLVVDENIKYVHPNLLSSSERKIGLWFRLQWFFAGSSALLPSSKSMWLSLGIAVGVVLMVVSLAVMAQAGMLAGSWLLGSTLTSAALWLAAQLSITGLGLPGLIALAVVGAWFAMLCIAEWKFPGMFGTVLFGFVSFQPRGYRVPVGSDNTLIHQTRYEYDQESFTLLGVLSSSIENSRRVIPVPVVGVMLFNFLELFLLHGINAIALYFSPESEDKPSHPFFATFKWLIHLVFVVITVPLLALAAIVDSLYLAARFVYMDATAKPGRLDGRVSVEEAGEPAAASLPLSSSHLSQSQLPELEMKVTKKKGESNIHSWKVVEQRGDLEKRKLLNGDIQYCNPKTEVFTSEEPQGYNELVPLMTSS